MLRSEWTTSPVCCLCSTNRSCHRHRATARLTGRECVMVVAEKSSFYLKLLKFVEAQNPQPFHSELAHVLCYRHRSCGVAAAGTAVAWKAKRRCAQTDWGACPSTMGGPKRAKKEEGYTCGNAWAKRGSR